ncbi:MAG: hypothetical protein M3305_09280 [Actinomycetota bacterium]|nr:hypothetical protein [Actinomycetota bacterium]
MRVLIPNPWTARAATALRPSGERRPYTCEDDQPRVVEPAPAADPIELATAGAVTAETRSTEAAI